nr:MAG TPA: hypothetical protein [Caudoviricetes sp.]
MVLSQCTALSVRACCQLVRPHLLTSYFFKDKDL